MYDTRDWVQVVQDAAVGLAFLSAVIAPVIGGG